MRESSEDCVHSTRIRIFLKTELFLSGYGFGPHVNGVFGNRNRSFSKTVSKTADFFNRVFFLEPCGQRKAEVFENDDIKCRGQAKTI